MLAVTDWFATDAEMGYDALDDAISDACLDPSNRDYYILKHVLGADIAVETAQEKELRITDVLAKISESGGDELLVDLIIAAYSGKATISIANKLCEMLVDESDLYDYVASLPEFAA